MNTPLSVEDGLCVRDGVSCSLEEGRFSKVEQNQTVTMANGRLRQDYCLKTGLTIGRLQLQM